MKISHEKEVIYQNIDSVSQLTEQVVNILKNNDVTYDSTNENVPYYIDTFTARALSTQTDADKIWIRGFDSSYSLSASSFYADHVFYSLQQLFFQENADGANRYITNPWTNASVSSLHCISFSNHLYKDELESFNADLVISITGNLETAQYIGLGTYDSAEFVYTTDAYTLSRTDLLSRATNALKIPKWDEAGLNYVFVQAKVYHNTEAATFYRLRGAILKDYGLVVLFDNPDSWPDFETARLVNKTDSSLGNEAYPAVWWSLFDQRIQYTCKRYNYDRKMFVSLGWEFANYTSNDTARNDDGDYAFKHLFNLEELTTMNKADWPKTYITTLYLMDEYNNVLAIGKFPNPLKKDFLNKYRFDVRIKI